MTKTKKNNPNSDNIYIYAQNAIQKLASYEGTKFKEWLGNQKVNEEGTFVYAYQLYMANKGFSTEEYVAEINSLVGNKYRVKNDGEIVVTIGK